MKKTFSRNAGRRVAGFTMIELIMVMVVLGILSVSASSLFSSKSAYVTLIAKDQLISMSLLAQQAALAQQKEVVVLCITQTSDEWVFEVHKTNCASSGADLYVQSKAERESATLLQDALAFASPQTFTYNKSASLSGGANIQFLFDGDSDQEVCLSSTGYAYSGVCQL